jgi:hypothetical protein
MNSASNSKGFFSGLTNAVSGAVTGVTNLITGNNKKNSNSNMKIVAPVANNSNSKPAAIPVVAGGRRKMRKTKTKARKTKRRASHKRRTGRKH